MEIFNLDSHWKCFHVSVFHIYILGGTFIYLDYLWVFCVVAHFGSDEDKLVFRQ